MLFEYHDLKARNPYLGLALDESLCLHLARNKLSMPFQGGFRLWSSPYSVILGRTCKVQEVLSYPPLFSSEAHAARRYKYKNTPFLQGALALCRRLSGGGTVLHGPGNLNYTIFLSLNAYPQMYPLKHSYNVLLNILKDALQAQNIACTLAGLSDLALIEKDGTLRKISGNAQFRRRQILVFHGTLITRKEIISKMKKYLSHPPKEPGYRSGRKHKDFMGYLPPSFDFAAFYNYFSKRIRELGGKNESLALLSLEQKRSVYALARRIAQKQYSHPEWILKGHNIRSLSQESDAWELDPASFSSISIKKTTAPESKKVIA